MVKTIIIGLLMLPFVVHAHLGGIVGKVIDAKTQQALVGANLVIKGRTQGTRTNDLGMFHIHNLKPATYLVEVSFLGYATEQKEVVVTDDEVMAVNFSLKSVDFSLAEVKVVANNPRNQQLISSLDMKLRTINNSQDVLRMIPGLFIGQHAGGGKAEQLFLRGFDLDHGTDINLTVDGVPINMVSHAHGQGYADAHFIIPELIENVAFKKGLYDADKGNFTTAGWANYQTKKVLDQHFIKTEIGQFNTYRLVGAVNLLGTKTKEQNQSAFLASEYNYSDAYFDNPQHFKRFNLFGKYHGHLHKNTSLTLTASTFWSRWDASGQIPDRAVADGSIGFYGAIDPNEGGTTSRTNLTIELSTLVKPNHVWKNQFFYSNYHFELYSNFTFYLEDSLNGDQIRQKEARNLWGYNSNYSIGHQLGNRDATFVLGLNYRHDMTNNSELSHTKNRSATLEQLQLGDINEANLGAFVEETVQLSPKVSAIAGLRFDYFHNQYTDHLANDKQSVTSASIVSPKFNLYYTLNPKLQFYSTSGKGFHSNDTRVVVAQKGIEVLPAAYGSDLGTIWKPFSNMVINAAYWYLWLNQEFVYVGDAGVVEPSGKSVRSGWDVSIRYQLAKNIFIDTDLNWAKPRAVGVAIGQDYLPLAPVFTSIGGLTLKNKTGFRGSFRYRYLTDRPANEDNTIVAKGYFVGDALLSYTYKKSTIGVSIQNIFNTKWKETQFATESRLHHETTSVEEIHFTPGTPFNVKLSITYTFF